MTGRKLPPLLAGAEYECPALNSLNFTAPDIARELRGEATSLLQLGFTNEVNLRIPLRAFQLQMLMCALIRTFPQQALLNLRLFEEAANAQDDPAAAEGKAKGAG